MTKMTKYLNKNDWKHKFSTDVLRELNKNIVHDNSKKNLKKRKTRFSNLFEYSGSVTKKSRYSEEKIKQKRKRYLSFLLGFFDYIIQFFKVSKKPIISEDLDLDFDYDSDDESFLYKN